MFRIYYFVVLINQILFLCVSSRPEPMDCQKTSKYLPMPNDYYKALADLVCENLDYDNASKCVKKFLHHIPSTLTPPTIDVKCRMTNTIRFEIEPSKYWQVLVLVPDNFTGVDKDDVNYCLVEAGTTFDELSTTLCNNCTIWSAVLDKDGIPSVWREGPQITPLNETLIAMKKIKYKVQIEYDNIKNDNGTFTMTGIFTWTSIKEDLCFDVINYCENMRYKMSSFWSKNPQYIIEGLTPGADCDFHVTSLYGSGDIFYHPPSCTKIKGCIPDKSIPEIPQNISLQAYESPDDANGTTWDLEVKWRKPEITPEKYNITVRTEANRTVVSVPGNDTKVVIHNVVGEGFYNVSVSATIGNKSSVNSKQAIFPDVGVGDGEWWGVGAWGWACGALGAGLALMAALLFRRAHLCTHAPHLYQPDETERKECDMEAIGLEPGTEDSWEVRSDRLLLHEVIGEGAFGVVRRGTLSPGEKEVAVKMLKDFPSLDEIRSFHAEMELMKNVGAHPHLVSLVGCCSGRKPLIIAEYCSKGDLLSFLRYSWDIMLAKHNAKYYNNNIDTTDYKNDLFKCKIERGHSKLAVNKMYDLQGLYDVDLTTLDLLSFCRQIAIGMEFLASNRVVHRDLAARNILVTGDRTLKIADFGLSRDVYEENQYQQKGNGKMPVKWMAIESLTRRTYTSQSDVWSFGVVMWEVVTVGGAPYPEVSAARLPRLLRAGYRMPRPNNCSKQLYELMLLCWRTNPRERPTFSELHTKLDELLNTACADDYLCLEVDADEPPAPKPYKYLKMFIRGKRNYTRGESYERPLKPTYSNRYTSLPVALTKTQPV